MGLKRLLATTDFSHRSERALRRAASICHESSAELQLLHVVDDDQPADLVEQESRQAEALLRSKAEALRETAGREPVIVVKAGDPFQEIVQTAIDVGADLIAMGGPSEEDPAGRVRGIERVMRTGHHPVLMVNAEPSGPYRRIIVATDMSPASANALSSAKGLGLLDGAYVSLLHAFEPFAKGMMIYANIEREKIEEHVARGARSEA
jgi:nucleotide-binding universal stress UspA family protein